MISRDRFRAIVYDYYKQNRRAMPWRSTKDPYRIVVSEIMLQQTQVPRVLVKYPEFIAALPDIRALAQAPLSAVLRLWQGLGYNRRALMLQQLARVVVSRYAAIIPDDRATLRSLPGIGDATAGSICAFAFDQPEVFIETNIRSVFIHHFFASRPSVRDTEILPLVARTLDTGHPREWYYALMDYGSYLKKITGNPSRKSSQYAKQSRFHGSDRQIRGRILKILLSSPSPVTVAGICAAAQVERARCRSIIGGLCKDGLITKRGATCCIT